jgi:23S rRNA (cytosine1962-C5)-methyltransferase
VSFEALHQEAFAGSELARLLHRVARQRRDLFSDCGVYRLHDADSEPLAGIGIERYGDFAVLDLYSKSAFQRRDEVARALIELGARGVYIKLRLKVDLRRSSVAMLAPNEPIAGEAAPPSFEVVECGRRYLVKLADGLSTGLFVDQRDNRNRLERGARGKRVLNLFCYTGSFSVAAGRGGASQVTSVDLANAVLGRVAENLTLNQLPRAQHRVLRADAVKWLGRAVRRGDRYDWVVFDPPSFASKGKEVFSIARDYLPALSDALCLVAGGGMVLAVTNHRRTSRERFLELVKDAARRAGREIAELELTAPGLDCPPSDRPDLSTKSALLRLR